MLKLLRTWWVRKTSPIDPRNISVVVQGAIDKNLTHLTLASIRKMLPGATIVLSTWKNSKVSHLDYDELVLSEDPGSVLCDAVHNVHNNVNRQITSSKNALLGIKTPYALKLRSDMVLCNRNFLYYFEQYDYARAPEWVLTKNRIIVNNLYCANPRRTNFCFHLSDWVQFGNTADLQALWNIPLQSDLSAKQYFYHHPRPSRDPVPTWVMQYLPEQYIWINFLKQKNITVSLQHFAHINKDLLLQSEKSFANNLLIVDYKDYGIKFLKYNPYKWDYSSQYTHQEWLDLFIKYCLEKNIDFALSPQLQRLQHILQSRDAFNRHYKKIFKPVERWGKKWLNTLAIPPLCLIHAVRMCYLKILLLRTKK